MMTYELTPSQLQIWKSQAISPRQPLFNQIVTARLNLPDATAATRQVVLAAWRQTQQIHRVLSSTIVADDNMQPRQQFNDAVHEMEQVDLDTVSMQEADAKHPDKALSRWISQRGSTVFQLDKQLTDAVLLHLGNQQLMVYLNMHHLIADALSTQWVLHTLIEALERKYPSAGIASEPQVADNAIRPFSDFALHVSENSRTAIIKRESNEPPETIEKTLSVETTTPETALQTPPAFYGVVNTHPNTESKRVRLDIGDDDLAKINLLAADPALRQFNNNLFLMCFHTSALALYLHKCTGESNLVIEAPLSGRFDARWKHTVGNLIEMVRIEINVSASDTLLALYQHVRSRVFETLQSISI